MTTPRFQSLSQSNSVAVMVALVAAVVAGAGLPDMRPFHVTCKIVQSNNHKQAFLGDPGAGSVQSADCELRFLSTKSRGFLKLTHRNITTSDALEPWTVNTSDISGASQIELHGNPIIQCHTSDRRLALGGNQRCQLSLWQLSPNFKGVVMRLSSGSRLSLYAVRPVSTPASARQVPR